MDLTLGRDEHALKRSFAQPADQSLPREFLAMLVELDRMHREASVGQRR